MHKPPFWHCFQLIAQTPEGSKHYQCLTCARQRKTENRMGSFIQQETLCLRLVCACSPQTLHYTDWVSCFPLYCSHGMGMSSKVKMHHRSSFN